MENQAPEVGRGRLSSTEGRPRGGSLVFPHAHFKVWTTEKGPRFKMYLMLLGDGSWKEGRK